MHRVELKELLLSSFNINNVVPNAPCGVERKELAKIEVG